MGFDIMGNNGDEGDDSLGSSFASSFSLPPPDRKETVDKDDIRSTAEGGTAAEDAAAGQDPKGHAQKDPVESTSTGPSPNAAIDAEIKKSDEAKEGGDAGSTQEEQNKKNLDELLVEWRKESSSARKKAEDTRAKIEQERAAAIQATDNSTKEEKRCAQQEKEEAELEKQIQAALSVPGPSTTASSRAHTKNKNRQAEREERWADVRDAWEIVKDGKSLAEGAEVVNEELAERGVEKFEEVEVDGRGMTAGDEGGKDGNRGLEMLADLKTATKAVTNHSSINPELAPDFEPKAGPAPTDAGKKAQQNQEDSEKKSEPSQASKGKAPKQADVANASSSAERGKELETEKGDTHKFPSSLPANLSKKSSPAESMDHFDNSHPNELIPSPNPSTPSHPPSLTLSLFTTPSRRTILRVTAVLGINLFLPFVNGVMLGFGEIFAREAFGFGRKWWTGQVRWGDLMRGSAVAGLGLQQAALETLP